LQIGFSPTIAFPGSAFECSFDVTFLALPQVSLLFLPKSISEKPFSLPTVVLPVCPFSESSPRFPIFSTVLFPRHFDPFPGPAYCRLTSHRSRRDCLSRVAIARVSLFLFLVRFQPVPDRLEKTLKGPSTGPLTPCFSLSLEHFSRGMDYPRPCQREGLVFCSSPRQLLKFLVFQLPNFWRVVHPRVRRVPIPFLFGSYLRSTTPWLSPTHYRLGFFPVSPPPPFVGFFLYLVPGRHPPNVGLSICRFGLVGISHLLLGREFFICPPPFHGPSLTSVILNKINPFAPTLFFWPARATLSGSACAFLRGFTSLGGYAVHPQWIGGVWHLNPHILRIRFPSIISLNAHKVATLTHKSLFLGSFTPLPLFFSLNPLVWRVFFRDRINWRSSLSPLHTVSHPIGTLFRCLDWAFDGSETITGLTIVFFCSP